MFQTVKSSLENEIIKKKEMKGIMVEFFEMDYLSSVEQIAEKCIMLGDETYCFVWNDKNIEFIETLVKTLKKMQPSCSIEYIEDVLNKSNKTPINENLTFVRGFVLSLTGNYLESQIDGTVKHLKMQLENLNESCLKKINELCNINSSICLESIEKIDIDKKLKQIDKLANHFKENHYLQMNTVISDLQTLLVNGSQVEEIQRIRKVPYSKWKKEYRQKKELLVYTINTEQDINEFEIDLRYYFENHTIDKSPLISGQIQMFCRFLNQQNCNVKKLPEITVLGDGTVYPCNQHEYPIGNITEMNRNKLLENCNILDENKKVERGCEECAYAESCSKCSFIPTTLAKYFCKVISEYPFISNFHFESNIIFGMTQKYKPYRQAKLTDIKISNKYFQSITKDIYTGKRLKDVLFYPQVFLTAYKNLYTIYSPITTKIYNIGFEYAVVAECVFRRIPKMEICNVLEGITKLQKSDCEVIVHSAIERFKDHQLYI